MTKYTLIATGVLFLGSLCKVMGQEESRGTIKYKFSSTNNYVDMIEFLDESGSVTKRFDLVKHNPFNQLGYRVIKKSETNNNVYDLSGYTLNQIVPDRSNYDNDPGNVELGEATSFFNVYEGKDYTAILYAFGAYLLPSKTVGYNATVLVFDKTGNQIGKIESINVGVRSPVLTDNGKYLALTYGGPYDASFQYLVKQGFKIYEVTTGKTIIDKKPNNCGVLGPPATQHNMMVFACHKKGGHQMYICDINKRMLYSKFYTIEQLSKRRGISEKGDGVYFQDEKQNVTIDFFEQNFDKERF